MCRFLRVERFTGGRMPDSVVLHGVSADDMIADVHFTTLDRPDTGLRRWPDCIASDLSGGGSRSRRAADAPVWRPS